MYIVVVQLPKSCLTFCDPIDFITDCVLIPHHHPKFVQVHVHCISDAIQSLTPCFLSALNLSQHQGFL